MLSRDRLLSDPSCWCLSCLAWCGHNSSNGNSRASKSWVNWSSSSVTRSNRLPTSPISSSSSSVKSADREWKESIGELSLLTSRRYWSRRLADRQEVLWRRGVGNWRRLKKSSFSSKKMRKVNKDNPAQMAIKIGCSGMGPALATNDVYFLASFRRNGCKWKNHKVYRKLTNRSVWRWSKLEWPTAGIDEELFERPFLDPDATVRRMWQEILQYELPWVFDSKVELPFR